jgi:hypothetical protein
MPYRNKPVIVWAISILANAIESAMNAFCPASSRVQRKIDTSAPKHYEAHWDDCVNAIRTTKVQDAVRLQKQ